MDVLIFNWRNADVKYRGYMQILFKLMCEKLSEDKRASTEIIYVNSKWIFSIGNKTSFNEILLCVIVAFDRK